MNNDERRTLADDVEPTNSLFPASSLHVARPRRNLPLPGSLAGQCLESIKGT